MPLLNAQYLDAAGLGLVTVLMNQTGQQEYRQ
jgi:hypothetical protein